MPSVLCVITWKWDCMVIFAEVSYYFQQFFKLSMPRRDLFFHFFVLVSCLKGIYKKFVVNISHPNLAECSAWRQTWTQKSENRSKTEDTCRNPTTKKTKILRKWGQNLNTMKMGIQTIKLGSTRKSKISSQSEGGGGGGLNRRAYTGPYIGIYIYMHQIVYIYMHQINVHVYVCNYKKNHMDCVHLTLIMVIMFSLLVNCNYKYPSYQ